MKNVLDIHTHTLASGHAYNTITEMAKAASEKGMELLGITEHAPAMPGTCHEFYFLNLKILKRSMYGITVLFGTEVNIVNYNGKLDLREGILKKMDLVIASLHIPCLKPGTKEENTRAYLKAMENPYVNVIGHPDDSRYPIDYEALVKGAKEYHVLLELNNNSLNPEGGRENPLPNDLEMLKLCKEYKVPIVINSDAHWMDDIGNHCYCDSVLKAVDFPEELIVNRSVEEIKKYLNYYKR
ncbi:MAG: phosphatase [Eubacteriales bacterium]|nr:phosphatase [Eubacteriales bacterium]